MPPSRAIMVELASSCPPPVPAHPLWKFEPTSFLIRTSPGADPNAYLRSIQTCIERLSKSCEVIRLKSGSSLKVFVTPRAGGQFLLKIKLYTVGGARATWAVEFQKRSGRPSRSIISSTPSSGDPSGRAAEANLARNGALNAIVCENLCLPH